MHFQRDKTRKLLIFRTNQQSSSIMSPPKQIQNDFWGATNSSSMEEILSHDAPSRIIRVA